MRLHRHLSIIAAAATMAAVTAPVATASDIGEGGGGGLPPVPHHAVATPHHSGSTDWALIALAGGGSVALIGAGIGTARSAGRRRASTSNEAAA
jgi:hypothetical protein